MRRESERTKHKCLDKRERPVSQQRVVAQCNVCKKWSRSSGGLAVHKCKLKWRSGSPED